MTQQLDERQLRDLFRPGQRVYVGGSVNEPRGLIEVLAGNADTAAAAIEGITFVQQPLAVNETDLSSLGPDCRQQTFFMTPALTEGLAAGRVDFIPMQMRAIYAFLERQTFDLVLLQAARDLNGQLRFGPNVDYVGAALAGARQVVLQVNPSFVAPLGCPLIDPASPYLLFERASPKPLYPLSQVDETSSRIGALVAGIVRDGDCLQTGIGAVPAAILADLEDRQDLGFHGGLIDDGVMRLVRRGNMTGARKSIDTGVHIAGMALGSEALLEWAGQEQSLSFRGANYTHEVSVISQLDNFVSVNSAVEVDLDGQVNAEVVGGRQISGTGGSVEFMQAARASRNGRSIVAMTATARRGSVSRIVPRVEMVTALRTDVDMVVTEFGIADIRDAPLPVRAERLIEIAHPDFRDQLREAFRSGSGRGHPAS